MAIPPALNLRGGPAISTYYNYYRTHYVYWIHDDTCIDPKTDGYVGITYDRKLRFSIHRKVHRKTNRYPTKSDLKFTILHECVDREEAFNIEASYRPHEMIGWNKAPGSKTNCTKLGARYAKKFEFNGKNLTVKEWAAEIGIKLGTLQSRLRRMNFEQAICYNRNITQYEYNGETHTLYGWSKKTGISTATLHVRLVLLGWTITEAIETPVDSRFGGAGRGKKYSYNGKNLTLSEWSKELGLNCEVLIQRLHALNWSLEKALTTPLLDNRKIDEDVVYPVT